MNAHAKHLEVTAVVLIRPDGTPHLMERSALSLETWPRGHRFAALLVFRDGQTHVEMEPGCLDAVQTVSPEFAALVRERTHHVDPRVKRGWLLDWKASQPPMN
jgi:hypothetical protein